MKKLLLTLLCIGSALATCADSYTIEFKKADSDATKFDASQLYEEGSEYIKSQTQANAYSPAIKGLKLSSAKQNGQLVITLSESGQVAATSIVVNAAQWKNTEAATININKSNSAASLSADLQDYTFNLDGSVITTITIDATKRCYVASITVNYDAGQVDPDKQPVKLSFGENADVTLSADEISTFVAPTLTTDPADLSVSYESNNATVATVDAEGNVTLTGATGNATIKASFDGDDTYAAGSASYVIKVIPTYYTLADLIQHETKEDVAAVGNFAVLYQSGDYLIVTNGISNALIYGSSETYDLGTKISKIKGTVDFYGNLFELKNATLTEGGEGAEYTVKEISSNKDVTIADNLFDKIITKGATVSGVNGKNATLTLANGETIALYNTFNITEGFENAENVTITGFVWRFNDNLQIAPISIENPNQKKKPELSYSEEAVEVILGHTEFVAPVLSNPNNLTVTYASSNEAVATIDAEGKVTLTGEIGETEISATFVENDEYTGATVSYTITVKEFSLETTFDFTICDGINFGEGFTVPVSQSTGTDFSECSKDNIQISFEGTGNSSRIWKTKDGIELRAYKDKSMTITAPAGYVCSSIKFNMTKGDISLNSEYNGSYENKEWTAPENEEIMSVKFDIATSIVITSITVTLEPATPPAAPVVTINGELKNIDEEIDLKGGSVTVTLTAEEGHHIYHKHEAKVIPADYYFDVETEGEHAEFNKVENHTADVTVDKNGTLTFYAHNPKTNLKSEPVSLSFYNDNTTSISEIEAAGKVEYFDMQGRRVAAPANGLYIRREGNVATKVRL